MKKESPKIITAKPEMMQCSSLAFLSATKPNLHTQDISHGLSSFFLCRCCNKGIGVQGEARGEVTQHTADRLNIHSVLQRDGCESVAEVMKSDLRDAGPLQYPLQHVVHAVRGDGTTVGRMGRCMDPSTLWSLLSAVSELLSLAVRWSQCGRSSLFSVVLPRFDRPLLLLAAVS